VFTVVGRHDLLKAEGILQFLTKQRNTGEFADQQDLIDLGDGQPATLHETFRHGHRFMDRLVDQRPKHFGVFLGADSPGDSVYADTGVLDRGDDEMVPSEWLLRRLEDPLQGLCQLALEQRPGTVVEKGGSPKLDTVMKLSRA